MADQRETVQPGLARGRWMLAGIGLLSLGVLFVVALYLTVPRGNEGTGPVDALLVLGTPADLHGELTQMQRWRTDEAVREFRAARAPRILFSGGPTANPFVEAEVMARYAESQGVPSSAILLEARSHTTLQNIANSAAILRARGWNRVEVISTPEHLRRAAVMLEKTGLSWRTHPAPTPGRGDAQIVLAFAEEAVGTAALRVFGTRAEPVLHAVAMVQHGLAWSVRWVVYKVEGWIEPR